MTLDTNINVIWGMSSERAFIENLVGQRVNYLLIFFGLVISGAIQTYDKPVAFQANILMFGSFMSAMMTATIWRAQYKLECIFAHLHKEKSHPYTIIDEQVGRGGSVRKIIGYFVPATCTFILLVLMVLSWSGWLTKCPVGLLPV